MIKTVVILAIVCQCVWLTKSEESSLLHVRSFDGELEQRQFQDRVWRNIPKLSPREEPQWTDSSGIEVFGAGTQDAPTALTATETRAAKIDLVTLIITVVTNLFWGVLNYMVQNYIGIFYNLVNIVEALLLFFWGS